MKKSIILGLLILMTLAMFVSCSSGPDAADAKGLTIVFKDTKYNGNVVAGLDGTYTIVDSTDTLSSDSTKDEYGYYKLYKQDGTVSDFAVSFIYDSDQLCLNVYNAGTLACKWRSDEGTPKGSLTYQNNEITLNAISGIFYEGNGYFKTVTEDYKGTVEITVNKDITLRTYIFAN